MNKNITQPMPITHNLHTDTDSRHSRHRHLLGWLLGCAIIIASALGSTLTLAPVTSNAAGVLAPVAVTPIPCQPTATALGLAVMRRSPSARTQRLAILRYGDRAHITARLANGAWFQVLFDNQPGWVPANLVTATCNANVPAVPAQPVPPVLNAAGFYANPGTIAAGQCSTLNWNVTGVAAVYFVDNNTAMGTAGQFHRTVCPRATTQYGLYVRRKDGTAFYSLTSVVVTGVLPAIDTGNFRADLTIVTPGQCTTLSWNVSNAASVFYTENGRTIGVAGAASRVVCPQTTTQYSLLVKKNDGSSFNSVVVVNVVPPVAPTPTPPPPPPPAPNFRADSTAIDLGQCTILRWNIDNVAGVYLIQNGGVVGVPGNYSQQVCPTNGTTYVLRVQRRDGSTFDSALTVAVNGLGVNPNFRADNTTLVLSQCTILRWNVDNINGVWFWDPNNRNPTSGNTTRQVCPQVTTTYRLEVLRRDGVTNNFYVTINVSGGASNSNTVPTPQA